MSNELEMLRARLDRLEAKEACLSTFNEYLHYLDGEFTEDLISLFASDARLDVMNYPPGSGVDLAFQGREEIRAIYADHLGSLSRHHTENVTVNVRPGGKTADVSAYFLTAINFGITGGLYEATLALVEGKWRFSWLRVSSNWGWIIPQEFPPFLGDALSAGARGKGRPVLYEFPEPKA